MKALIGILTNPRYELIGLYMIAGKTIATPTIAINNLLLGLLTKTGLAVLTISITTIAEITDSNIQPVWNNYSFDIKKKSNTAKVI